MKIGLFTGLALLAVPLFSQKTGWQLIAEDNWPAARAAFDRELAARPADEGALTGRLFLQETLQEQTGYQKTANQLIRSAWRPEMVVLFGHLFDGDAAEVAAHRELPVAVRMPFEMGVADSFYYNRRFEDYKKQLAATVQDHCWTVAGPFADEGGAGHIAAYAPETTAFEEKQSFFTESGRELGWLRNQRREADGACTFERLAGAHGLATCYASTFLTFEKDGEVQLRLRRSSPMKIWLDGQPLADLPEPASNRWDLDIFTLKIPAGTHRLLVKTSQFPSDGGGTHIDLGFNDHRNDGDGFDGDGFGGDFGPEAEGGNEFTLRVTDREGRMLGGLRSDFSGKAAPAAAPFEAKFESHPFLEIFKKRAEKGGDGQPASLYLLAKMFLKYEKTEEGEAFFAQKLAAQPGSAFLKFILAKFFNENGKGERAEALLSGLDTAATPAFAWELKKVNDIDPQQREAEHLAGLERLLALSPGHWQVMSRYLRFLKEKGRREVIEPFVKKELTAHGRDKKWHDRLDPYLEADSYRPETEKEPTDREREKQFKAARKLLKKRVDYDAYSTVIDYFKQKDRAGDVLKTLDEIISFQHWSTGWRFERARFLFEKNRLDEALAACRELVADEPFSSELFELMGDIFLEKKDKTEALAFYKKAKKHGGRYQYGIAEKIEKLENRRKYSQFFAPIDLEKVARDTSWRGLFREEDSVISHFSSQNWLDEDAQMQSATRLAVHIQTEAGARAWTEADLRIMGNITAARVLKPDGSSTSPDLGYGGMAVFKGLGPGDIITMEGANSMPLPDEIEGEFLLFEALPLRAPVVEARFEVLVPEDTALAFACNRLDCQPTTTDAGEGLVKHSFLWKNIAKTDETEGATPENLDRLAWFMASSARDWRPVVDWYLQKTYRRTEANYEVKQKVAELLRPGMTERQKVDALYAFITREVRYSFVPFLNSSYVPKRPSETIAGAVGDCKDVASLMISMLREAGIPAWHTLVSTHSFSEKEPRPTLFVFNHAIAAWQSSEGQLNFLDLTTDYFPSSTLPEMDNGAWGLVIRPGETALRRLPEDLFDEKKTRIELTARASIGRDRSLAIETEGVLHGVAAGKFREILVPKTADERLKWLADYFGGGSVGNLVFEKTSFDSLENLAAPLRMGLSLRAFNQVDRVSDFHIVPLPLPMTLPARRELFAETRHNDLDLQDLFELAPVIETVELALPEGWSLMEVPKGAQRSGEWGEYALSFEEKGRSLVVRRSLSFKKRFVPWGEYGRFKAFYMEVSDLDGTKIALRQGR